MSLSEPFVKPSTMLYRNLLAMETEELLRSHPIDGAVLMQRPAHGQPTPWRVASDGIALSPEYVYAMPPGGIIPDDRRFGVLWMSRRALEAATAQTSTTQ